MKTKQLIAIILALLTAAALLAGCEKNLDVNEPGQNVNTGPALTPDALEDALHNLGSDDIEGLTPEQIKQLEKDLKNKGLLAEDVTLPVVSSTAPATMPPTMPAGVDVQPSEVYPLLKAVMDIFASHRQITLVPA